jgi:hypothetical protein
MLGNVFEKRPIGNPNPKIEAYQEETRIEVNNLGDNAGSGRLEAKDSFWL